MKTQNMYERLESFYVRDVAVVFVSWEYKKKTFNLSISGEYPADILPVTGNESPQRAAADRRRTNKDRQANRTHPALAHPSIHRR